jgi:hypothetical protein
MAYHKICLILAKILWNFDLELCDETGTSQTREKFMFCVRRGLYGVFEAY